MKVITMKVESMEYRSCGDAGKEKRKHLLRTVHEVQYKAEGDKMFGCKEERYKFWWSGEKKKRGGMGILVTEDLVEEVIQVKRIN